ncbi:biotin--[acetyl-CoA-carboxylase] ligase [Candidatus Puniceispirillum sp.]|uniref:biotin--[acetyl-CoA-carboxylase] ligase n=1 Tax=Candidatus Puniceispirillum sp. TaxID=2026719 RepID=UPI003F6986FF
MVTSAAWTFSTADVAKSSSDLARKAALDGAPTGTGFLVGVQTAGRGRRGRTWLSPQGGMYLSIVLRPNCDKYLWPLLSFVAALAARETIENVLVSHQPKVKWPNDILVNNRKICGILLEVVEDALIVGTGINVAPIKADRAMPGHLSPTSLVELGDNVTTPALLATDYIDNLARRYETFNPTAFTPVRDEWMRHAAFLNQNVTVMDSGLKGRFTGIDEDGSMLLVDASGKTHHITTGDVVLMDDGN